MRSGEPGGLASPRPRPLQPGCIPPTRPCGPRPAPPGPASPKGCGPLPRLRLGWDSSSAGGSTPEIWRGGGYKPCRASRVAAFVCKHPARRALPVCLAPPRGGAIRKGRGQKVVRGQRGGARVPSTPPRGGARGRAGPAGWREGPFEERATRQLPEPVGRQAADPPSQEVPGPACPSSLAYL